MQDIFPKKYYLLRKKQLEFSIKHSINENNLTANELLKKRLKKYKVSSFWGSFIKNGVRPTHVYFYVLKTFRLFLGLSVSFFIRMAFELLRPVVYLKPRRFGALIHLIPRLITIKQGFNLAKRFLIKSIRRRRELRLEDRIMSELVDVFSFKSRAFRYKKRVYAEVIENRVFLRRRRGKKSF